MGLKTLTKLLNTRALSPFYIREAKPVRGRRRRKKKKEGLGGERNGKKESGKRTNTEVRRVEPPKLAGKGSTNANVNAEERRYRNCGYSARRQTRNSV